MDAAVQREQLSLRRLSHFHQKMKQLQKGILYSSVTGVYAAFLGMSLYDTNVKSLSRRWRISLRILTVAALVTTAFLVVCSVFFRPNWLPDVQQCINYQPWFYLLFASPFLIIGLISAFLSLEFQPAVFKQIHNATAVWFTVYLVVLLQWFSVAF